MGLCHIQYQIEKLYRSDDCRDDHRDDGKYNAVVANGNRVSRQLRAGVQTHHQRAVRRIQQAHPGGKQQRKDQDEPYRRPFRSLYGRDTQDCDLRRRIKAETEEYAERVHLPRSVDQFEQLLQDGKEAATSLYLEFFELGARLASNHSPHLDNELVQDVNVHDTQKQ